MRRVVRRFAVLMAAVGVAAASVVTASPATAATYGPYLFISNSSHLCMETAGFSNANGAGVQQWYCHGGTTQKWSMVDVKTVGSTHYYQLVNQNSNKCLDIPGGNRVAGAVLQQWDCWGGENAQLWAVETQPQSGPVPTSRIKTFDPDGTGTQPGTGLCVDVQNWSNDPGTSLQLWPCWDGPPQQWHIP